MGTQVNSGAPIYQLEKGRLHNLCASFSSQEQETNTYFWISVGNTLQDRTFLSSCVTLGKLLHLSGLLLLFLEKNKGDASRSLPQL